MSAEKKLHFLCRPAGFPMLWWRVSPLRGKPRRNRSNEREVKGRVARSDGREVKTCDDDDDGLMKTIAAVA